MPGRRRPPSPAPLRARVVAALACLCLSCTDGTGPGGPGWSAPLDLRPQFQVDPDLFPSAPIDHIRLVAKEVETSQVVGSADLEVDPDADEWELSLAIDMGDATSLAVIVEVELMSGQTVEWSGRLGPIPVQRSATPQVRSVEIHRGPLENLSVLALDIGGAPTQMNVGASATLTAQLTLPDGLEASPTVYWATSDPTVATVTATGTTVTLTAVGPGTVDVVATSGAADDQVTVTVVEIAPPDYDVEWRGTTPDWLDPGNWSTGAVPAEDDDVYIAVAEAYPLLVTSVTVGSLGIEAGASLTLGDAVLIVNGDLDAAGTILGGASVVLAGTDVTVRGSLEVYLDVSGTATASGQVGALGMFLSGTGARFDVAGQVVTLQGPLFATQGAALEMSSGALIATDVNFDGGSTQGLLTGGTLYVSGDFAAGTDPLSFAASGGHTVVFEGTQPQQISFSSPGAQGQRFQNVIVESGAEVSVASGLAAAGNLRVDGSLFLGPYAASVCCTVSVGGTLVVPQGSTLTIGTVLVLEPGSTLSVDGTIDVPTCSDQGATVTGSGTHPCVPPPAGTRTWTGEIDVDWHNAANWAEGQVPGPSDDVVIPGGSVIVASDVTVASLAMGSTAFLELDGFTLTVTGEVSQDAGAFGIAQGRVVLTGPGSTLGGSYADLELRADRAVAGNLYVSGSLTVLNADLVVGGNSVYVAGSFTLTGDDAQLVMTNANSTVSVLEDALFDGGDHEGLLTAGTLSVYGDFTVTDRSPTSFAADAGHVLMLGGSAPDQIVSFAVPGPTQQRMGRVTIGGVGDRTRLASNAYAVGDATVTGWLTLSPSVTFSIAGDLYPVTGAILEVDPSATLNAQACFATGAIIIGTDENQPCGTPLPVDRIWLGGSTTAPDAWEEPGNWEPLGGQPAGAPGPTDFVLIPYRESWPLLNDDVAVGGLALHYSGTVDVNGYTLDVAGDAISYGSITGGEVRMIGEGTRLEGYFDDLRIASPYALSNFLVVGGTLYVDAPLVIGPENATVSLDLLVSGEGALDMRDPQSGVYVYGDVVFDGGSEDRLLAQGIIYTEGDFTALCSQTPTCFVSDGTIVQFGGSQPEQVITLTDPATQVFQTVNLYNSASTSTTLASPIVVGDLFTTANVTFRAAQPGAYLEVRGSVSASQVTFDGVPLRIVNPVAPNGPWANSHFLDRLTFTNMPQGVVQFYVESPMNPATGQPMTLASPVFLSTPDGDTGFHVQAANPAPTNGILVINVTNPSPGTGILRIDQFSQIVWPYP